MDFPNTNVYFNSISPGRSRAEYFPLNQPDDNQPPAQSSRSTSSHQRNVQSISELEWKQTLQALRQESTVNELKIYNMRKTLKMFFYGESHRFHEQTFSAASRIFFAWCAEISYFASNDSILLRMIFSEYVENRRTVQKEAEKIISKIIIPSKSTTRKQEINVSGKIPSKSTTRKQEINVSGKSGIFSGKQKC